MSSVVSYGDAYLNGWLGCVSGKAAALAVAHAAVGDHRRGAAHAQPADVAGDTAAAQPIWAVYRRDEHPEKAHWDYEPQLAIAVLAKPAEACRRAADASQNDQHADEANAFDALVAQDVCHVKVYETKSAAHAEQPAVLSVRLQASAELGGNEDEDEAPLVAVGDLIELFRFANRYLGRPVFQGETNRVHSCHGQEMNDSEVILDWQMAPDADSTSVRGGAPSNHNVMSLKTTE